LKSAPQLRAAIEEQLKIAKARWGDTSVELMCLGGRRGELMADALFLQRLRYFNLHGAGYAQIIEQVPRLRLWYRLLLPISNALGPITSYFRVCDAKVPDPSFSRRAPGVPPNARAPAGKATEEGAAERAATVSLRAAPSDGDAPEVCLTGGGGVRKKPETQPSVSGKISWSQQIANPRQPMPVAKLNQQPVI
jgi:hypothetical protein